MLVKVSIIVVNQVKRKCSNILLGKKSITVSWAKISGIKGYQIEIATDKKFKKNKIREKITASIIYIDAVSV